MSRKLDRQSAEANALRTLDERRQAPGYGQPAGSQPDNARMPPPNGYNSGPAYGPAPAQAPTQAPIIVRQDSGLGHVIAGAIIARSAANAHANNNNGGGYYPAPSGSTGGLATQAGANSVDQATVGKAASGGSVFGAIVRTVLWLLALALIGWIAHYAWKRMRSRREASKPNYSFERN
jgi:hypothetical protein